MFSRTFSPKCIWKRNFGHIFEGEISLGIVGRNIFANIWTFLAKDFRWNQIHGIGEILSFRGDGETHFRFKPSRKLSKKHASKNYSTRNSVFVKNKHRADSEQLFFFRFAYIAYP